MNALKSIIIRLISKNKLLKRMIVGAAVHGKLLPDIFVRTHSKQLRELFFAPSDNSVAQLNQDLFAAIFNRFKNNGYFIEIGANDGFDYSNTLYLERAFSWDGLLIEANPKYKESLSKRDAKSFIAAVADSDGIFEFVDADLYGGISESIDAETMKKNGFSSTIQVQGLKLQNILEKNSVPKDIDFISIDVEGAERSVLRQMLELTNYKIKCGCIEHNGREGEEEILTKMLEQSGYNILWSNSTVHDLFFSNPDFL